MGSNDYEYTRLLAGSWDFMRGDTSVFSDRQFYLDLVDKSGDPVLVVGCGTGRLLLEFVAGGLEADGVDVSPEMLQICANKAKQRFMKVDLYQQRMEKLDLPRQYQTILVPSFSFQLVPDLDDAKRTLTGFYRHLLPGGTLALSIWHIKRKEPAEWSNWWTVIEKDGFDGDKTLKRSERSMYDPQTQLRHTENRYEVIENGEIVYTENHMRSPELRNYTLGQITGLLQQAGFSGIRAFSGVSNQPATDDDGTTSILSQKEDAAGVLS